MKNDREKPVGRKRVRVIRKKEAGKEGFSGSPYFCDYSPRYEEDYNIYEKAREHSRNQRKKMEMMHETPETGKK